MSFNQDAFEQIYTKPSRTVVRILPQSDNGSVAFEICHQDNPECSLIGRDYRNREEAIKILGKVLQGFVDRGVEQVGRHPMYLRVATVESWLKKLKCSNSNRHT